MSFQDEMKQMFLQVAAGKVEPEEWEISDQFARNREIYSMELYDGNSVLIPLPSVQDSAAYEETGLTDRAPAGFSAPVSVPVGCGLADFPPGLLDLFPDDHKAGIGDQPRIGADVPPGFDMAGGRAADGPSSGHWGKA